MSPYTNMGVELSVEKVIGLWSHGLTDISQNLEQQGTGLTNPVLQPAPEQARTAAISPW